MFLLPILLLVNWSKFIPHFKGSFGFISIQLDATPSVARMEDVNTNITKNQNVKDLPTPLSAATAGVYEDLARTGPSWSDTPDNSEPDESNNEQTVNLKRMRNDIHTDKTRKLAKLVDIDSREDKRSNQIQSLNENQSPKVVNQIDIHVTIPEINNVRKGSSLNGSSLNVVKSKDDFTWNNLYQNHHNDKDNRCNETEYMNRNGTGILQSDPCADLV